MKPKIKKNPQKTLVLRASFKETPPESFPLKDFLGLSFAPFDIMPQGSKEAKINK